MVDIDEVKYQIFHRNVDDDGFLELPGYIYDDYGDAWISLGFGVYLHVMDGNVWVEFVEGFHELDILDEEGADMAGRMLPYATRLVKDSLGRVQIPKDLLEAAQIKNRVVGLNVGRYWRLIALELYKDQKTAL